MGIGLLFPGQASQFPGMGKELHDAYPAARRTFEEASEALSRDVAALCFRGTEEELRRTENTQPAIFTVSVAAFRVIAAETGVRPVCAAGHSLGEYSALVAAGVLPLRDAVRVLRSRGIYMQEAVPVGEGAMAAILGLAPKLVEEACRKGAALGVVSPANYNGGGQIVISGAAKAVAAACEAAKAAGAKRALPLPVSAPFHCALMGPAAERLTPELRAIPQGPFAFPVVANVTAAVYGSGDAVAEVLIRQITAPVRWEESVAAMRAAGATSFLEVGPGKVLSGLVRRIDREAPSSAFCAPADLVAVRAFLA
ncbi:MAG: [acyl-carrier-protein] S-malonyltransferase [Deltaproteobacteria bacterium GWB2_65_81]|nr:MAG: [acyl-carrier-protein] S-malonyltransferase [Deltaproteobacteria bacterium GWA2_65_63]OGP29083.1 MAG: [acyl-carrier-protein] S-malonyltransferase [Deltaproteobacteria bacterium GWB2_65_81]HAM32018.1 [acyl-carrier-protein] S-malonyltransferase [Deltaproteobacteria bacterium]